MFSLALPRFFGFSLAPKGRDGTPARSAATGRRDEPLSPTAPDAEELLRSATIGGRPAPQVLAALAAPDIETARQALADIYSTYFETLWHFAYRRLRSRDRAQELVHDVFLGVWTRRTTLDLQTEIGIYLRSAVRNLVYKDARHEAIVARMEFAMEGDTAELPAIGSMISPDMALEQAELDRMLTAALARIAPRDRDILTMRWIDRMTLDEIAGELVISKSRVRTILARVTARVAPVFEGLRRSRDDSHTKPSAP